jgi:hypothetical protein
MKIIWVALMAIAINTAHGSENWRPERWIVNTNKTDISYYTPIVTDKLYGIPEAETSEHKVKWLQHLNDDENTASLGYIVKVSMTAATITKTYLSYIVHLEYNLLDKDGFNLATITSPSHDIMAGITNPATTTIQNVIQGCANRIAVANTVRIIPRLIIEKRTTGGE